MADSVIANKGICHDNCLSRVRRIGQHFQITVIDVLNTISLITSRSEPILVPVNTVPSSSMRYAFIWGYLSFLMCLLMGQVISAQIVKIILYFDLLFNSFKG